MSKMVKRERKREKERVCLREREEWRQGGRIRKIQKEKNIQMGERNRET
jgi:hypothetical protein